MRPILRPGCHVLERGDGEIQIGIDTHRAVVLPATTAVRDTLAALTSRSLAGTGDPRTLRLLADSDLLIEQAALMPLVPVDAAAARDISLSREAAAALALSSGDDAPERARKLSAHRVEVVPFGNPAGRKWSQQAADLLVASGMRATGSTGSSGSTGGSRGSGTVGAARGSRGQSSRTSLAILIGVGEPPRELVDDWMRRGIPHMLTRLVEGSAIIGPLVIPGETACLRCVDAHCADLDPSWPLLVVQYAAASARDRADGAPEPVDPALASLALAWAVRDLVSFAQGDRPATWSGTVRIEALLSAVESRQWLRHPACGCSWA